MNTRPVLGLLLCFFAVPQLAYAAADGVFLEPASLSELEPAVKEEAEGELLPPHVAQVSAWLNAVQSAAKTLQENPAIRLADLSQNQREALAVLLRMVALPAEAQAEYTIKHDALPGSGAISAALEQKETWQRWHEGIAFLHALNAKADAVTQRLKTRAPYRGLGSYWGTLSPEQNPESLPELPDESPAPSPLGTSSAALEAELNALDAELAEYWLYLTLLDEFHGQWQNPATLLPQVEAALARQPNMPLLLLAQAELLLQLERPRAALAPVNAALAVLEHSPLGTVADKNAPSLKTRALRLRGLIQLHTGQAALAEEDMSTALLREPQQAVLWLTRGAIRQVRGNAAGMCLDYAEACNRGLCEGLAAARADNLCLP